MPNFTRILTIECLYPIFTLLELGKLVPQLSTHLVGTVWTGPDPHHQLTASLESYAIRELSVEVVGSAVPTVRNEIIKT